MSSGGSGRDVRMWPRLAWVFASCSTSEGLFVGGLKGTDGEIVEGCES